VINISETSETDISDLLFLQTDYSLTDIPFSGPYKINRMIDNLSLDEREEFIESLRNPENQSHLAQLMFFQKYLYKNSPIFAKRVESTAIGNHLEHILSSNDFIPYSLSRYNDEELRIIYSNIEWIQITQGCGGDCVHGCGVDAVSKVRDRIPFEYVINTLKNIAENRERKNPPNLYFASDPLEIGKNNPEFFLIAENYHRIFNSPLNISTSIPAGNEELYKEICRRKPGYINLRVSITEQNIKRLKKQGILIHDEINSFPFFPGVNPRIAPGIFHEDYRPNLGVNLVTEDYRENLGINRYKIPGNKRNFCNISALIMTPYGILNTIGVPCVNDNYPQGRIVVSVDKISDEPFIFNEGDNIDKYLTDCIVRYNGAQQSDRRFFYLSNLSYNAGVLIDEECKILDYDNNVSHQRFFR
jgi:hypothetical protein